MRPPKSKRPKKVDDKRPIQWKDGVSHFERVGDTSAAVVPPPPDAPPPAPPEPTPAPKKKRAK